MNIFTSKDRLISVLSYPITILSICLFGLYVLNFTPFDWESSFLEIPSFLWSLLCGGFVSLAFSKDCKKAISLSASLLFCNLIYYSMSDRTLGYLIVLALALFFAFVLKNSNTSYFIALSLFLGIVVGVFMGVLSDFSYTLLRSIAALIKGRGATFGVINELYSITFGTSFSDLFYHRDYGGTLYIDNHILSGAVDIFSVSNKASVVASLLTGKYISNIFLSLGMFFSLFSKVRDKYLAPFLISFLLAVICGDNTMLSVFLFFYNPFVYAGFLGVNAISYLVCRLVDLRIGFLYSASLIELIKYANRVGYFLLIGIVSAVLMYYTTVLILSRCDFDNNKYLPKQVRKLVSALGGERNIEYLDSGKLYVKNPNLIDILKVDCDIHENEISLIDTDFELLSQYF